MGWYSAILADELQVRGQAIKGVNITGVEERLGLIVLPANGNYDL